MVSQRVRHIAGQHWADAEAVVVVVWPHLEAGVLGIQVPVKSQGLGVTKILGIILKLTN